MLEGGFPHAPDKLDSQTVPAVNKVFYSPSKIDDLRRYFSLYPEHLLPMDLFVDLLIYQTVVVVEKGYGGLFYRGDIDRMRWKDQLEDLVNSDSLEFDGGFEPSPRYWRIIIKIRRPEYYLRDLEEKIERCRGAGLTEMYAKNPGKVILTFDKIVGTDFSRI